MKEGWLAQEANYWQLSEAGMEMEDAIGPMFFSEQVKNLIRDFELNS